VGDIVEVKGTESIPADMVLLYVNNPKREAGEPPDTACYVETKGLDGESNQKVREAHGKCARRMEEIEAQQGVSPAEAVGELDMKLRCELPNTNIANFDGSVYTAGASDPSTEDSWGESIADHSVLLRGCRLQQEGKGSVYGLVVFTGGETKVQMSAGVTPSKLRYASRRSPSRLHHGDTQDVLTRKACFSSNTPPLHRLPPHLLRFPPTSSIDKQLDMLITILGVGGLSFFCCIGATCATIYQYQELITGAW
jgi:magnesium-transporting ATPase (P-type)